MPATAKLDFVGILRELRRHEVEFIVVGGVAAVLEGVPANTFDLDVVHSRAPGNVDRLLLALEGLDAGYRMTLDVLGSIGRSRSFPDLLPHTTQVEVAQGLRVQALNLETLIAVKEEVAGEKDVAMLPLMRRTLQEKRRPA